MGFRWFRSKKKEKGDQQPPAESGIENDTEAEGVERDLETIPEQIKLEKEKNVPEEKAVKVIMTTALNEERNVKMAFELGCTIYSGKPINQDRFEQALKKLDLI